MTRPIESRHTRRWHGMHGRSLSLVDAVLPAIIEDTNVAVAAMLTFNKRDFHDVCRQRAIELPWRSLPIGARFNAIFHPRNTA